MTEEIEVSAVITTHNRLDLIEGAIESVLAQEGVSMELIVVDDASTDGTAEYLQQRKDITAIIVPKDESSGANHARNLGIGAARGRYVAFLDDDDLWMPGKTRLQLEELRRRPECKAVGCLRQFFSDEGAEWSERRRPSGDLSETVLYVIPFSTSTLMVERELLLGVGCFDESLSRWQEYELEMRLFQQCPVACVDEPLVRYRVSSTDPSRLSLNLDQWEKSVAIIEEKHRGMIETAPKDVRARRQQMINIDGAKRADSLGMRRECRRYLAKAFLARPTVKGLIKLIIGKPSRHRI